MGCGSWVMLTMEVSALVAKVLVVPVSRIWRVTVTGGSSECVMLLSLFNFVLTILRSLDSPLFQGLLVLLGSTFSLSVMRGVKGFLCQMVSSPLRRFM